MAAALQPAGTFQNLIVWARAHEFVVRVYQLTTTFPQQETCGLCSQLGRAAGSIPRNIVARLR